MSRAAVLIEALLEPGRTHSAARRAIARELHMGTGQCRDRAEVLAGRLLEVSTRAAIAELEEQDG